MTHPSGADVNRWRTATFALALVLLLVLVAWTMREQSITSDHDREREQWEADRRLMEEMREEQSHELERLDLTIDEMRRQLHHSATTRPAQ